MTVEKKHWKEKNSTKFLCESHIFSTLCEARSPFVLYLRFSVSPALCHRLVTCQEWLTKSNSSRSRCAPPIRCDFGFWYHGQSCRLWNWLSNKSGNFSLRAHRRRRADEASRLLAASWCFPDGGPANECVSFLKSSRAFDHRDDFRSA